MFLWLTCLTFCPRVCLCECTSRFNERWSLLCVLTVGCSWTDRNKRPRPTQTTLLLSAYAHTHIVWCTINALVSLNYLLHQSFSSAISQGPTCLWGSQGQPPAGMLHLISGLLGCLFLWAQRGWCCASCIDSHCGRNAVDQWMVLWSLQIRFQRFCCDVKEKKTKNIWIWNMGHLGRICMSSLVRCSTQFISSFNETERECTLRCMTSLIRRLISLVLLQECHNHYSELKNN